MHFCLPILIGNLSARKAALLGLVANQSVGFLVRKEARTSFFDARSQTGGSLRFPKKCPNSTMNLDNLPKNAPAWVRNPQGGEGRVTIEKDGEFTVVRLMLENKSGKKGKGKGSHWFSHEVYATRDGVADHTDEFKELDAKRSKQKKIETFVGMGLSDVEAERMFWICRDRTDKEILLLSKHSKLLRGVFSESYKQIAFTKNDLHRAQVCAGTGLMSVFTEANMVLIEVVIFCKAAAWIFHGTQLPGYRKKRNKVRAKGSRGISNVPMNLRHQAAA